MDSGFNNLKMLFDNLKSMGFWARLFGWGKIKTLLIDASADLQKLISSIETLRSENSKLENSISRLSEDKAHFQKELGTLKEKNDNYLKRGTELSNELAVMREKVEMLRDENTKFRTAEEQRRVDYEKSISNLNKVLDRNTKERIDERERVHQAEIEKLRRLKETWSNHETNVKNRIKAICNRNGVEYMDQVPFKGKPDNTLKIKDEYIVLDAKSPSGDDLSNFPSYLKNQVESAIKYVKEEDVRKEVFLVVPSNTLDYIQQFEYKLSEYTVYIISIDALEPIILALKKIEEYEFAEQLSPEERENICRVIGKFVHLSKRRIQIDGFFAKQFFELVYRSDADLPKEILEKVSEFERAEKINPPIEKRSKQISTKELEHDTASLKNEATLKGIVTEDALLSRGLNKLPLYSTEEPGKKPEEQSGLFD
jgi:ElaB/YqjD/DUF883 family membrane-anchored ribosome-binding protein